MNTAPSYPMPPQNASRPVGPTSFQQPPPMQPMQPMQAAPGQTVVVTAPIRYGKDPANVKCPYCQAQVQTSTSTKPGAAGNYLIIATRQEITIRIMGISIEKFGDNFNSFLLF